MGGAEEHRLEDLQSEAQKFGEGEGSGRIPPRCHPRVLQRPGHGRRQSWGRRGPGRTWSWDGAATRCSPLGMWIARSSDPLALLGPVGG